MKIRLILLIATIFICSCGTTKNMSVLKYYPPTQEEVEVMGIGQTIPEGAVMIGNITIGDTGFTSAYNCTYSIIIQQATSMAQQMEGI